MRNSYTRRLALAAVICCSTVQAEESKSSSLRGLLNQGWSAGQLTDDHVSQELRQSIVPSLIRPELKPIDVPNVLTPEEILKPKRAEGTNDSASASRVFDAPIVSPSLARLIQTRTERTEKPTHFHSEGIRLDLAPSVRRVDVDRQAVVSLDAKMQVVDQRVTAATPFQTVEEKEADSPAIPESKEVAPSPSALTMPILATDKVANGESTRSIDRPVADATAIERAVSQPTAEFVADASSTPKEEVVGSIDAEPSMASLLQTSDPRVVKDLDPDRSADQAINAQTKPNTKADQPFETDQGEENLTESIAEVPKQIVLPELPAPSEKGNVEETSIVSVPSSAQVESGPVDTAEDQLTQLPMPNGDRTLPLSQLSRQRPVTDQQALGSSLQVTRLRKLAQESLQTAYDRAARGADHSAKKYATEALRLAVATRDAMEGGNQNTRALGVAFDAIRETEDFCGRYGPANPTALGRMIVSHQTTVLKESDPDRLSAYEAADTYLSYARERLVKAGGTMPEASHALVLLGRLEKRVSRSGRTYCDAVSVTLHRAAIDIEPANAAAHCALGTTLLEQGLTEQASQALQRSVEISPTRTAYKGLLEVARRSGDAVAARACTAALNHPALGSDVPVMQLEIDAFVQTHRPNQIPSHPKQELSQPAVSQDQTPRIGLRSLFPFTRR